MINLIPFKPFPNYFFEITLSNVPYVFCFYWNNRGAYWTLDITDREQNEIIRGVKLVNNYELLSLYSNDKLPSGKLYVLDVLQKMDNVKYGDFITGECVLLFDDGNGIED